ncbi:DNA polymerase III subunit alpha [Marivirga sp. S37H4]|uniref:DNA-directed DNA polymerase n=1 Tax=Marivirga aurantiaca TaxID=2802615 RepID=A0A934WXF8_9BACT|nr:DNA polymerase III subunit alpha [Marivirga aurantiaca]MBK6264707.1 DNA polymerase III subunit alpha [Marivirga aurantiaca]
MYLNCHTYFSFKYGTLSPKELILEAYQKGVTSLALTDIHSTAAYIEVFRLLQKEYPHIPLKVIPGIEFRIEEQLAYIGLARNNEGFEELNASLSYYNRNELPLQTRPHFTDNVVIIYPLNTCPDQLNNNEFIGLKPEELNRLKFAKSNIPKEKLVALLPVTFKDKTGYNMHRLLRAIQQNQLLSRLPSSLQAGPTEFMRKSEEVKHIYQGLEFVLRNTEKLLEECHFEISLGTSKNKRTLLGSAIEDWHFFEAEARKGFMNRYGKKNDILTERFEREMEIIRQKDFTAYYLITHDMIRFAQRKGFPHVGRGSGANSMIAYCMGITNVDPIALDLYFERFLNPSRSSPPDFDIDFSWQNRDEVIQYLFDKHGLRHTSLLGTHTTMKARMMIRELGKVFGLPKEEIDKLAENPENYGRTDTYLQKVLHFTRHMVAREFPANISIHAGGVLITERPIYAYTATEMPPKGFPVSHFEMHNAEDIGIYKFDILSQRGLGHIKDSITLVEKNQGKKIDPRKTHTTVLEKDPKIKALISKGNTMGCFYVESPSMRMLLGKLNCQDYITLVAASSIIRPGVAQSGMMRAYVDRHHSNGNYEAIHPVMDELMKETYGVMVYQEDVIRVAHHFGGLTLSESDILRRGMSGKFRSRSEFQRVEDQFFKNCREKGYEEKVIQRVWYEISSFSGFSFAKGHSASFAVESYESLFLKAHFPLEFMVGVINNFGGFYKTEFYFHEARMNGANILPPCANSSEYLTNISGTDIHIGFVHIKDLEQKIAQLIPKEREKWGPFRSLTDFVERIPVKLDQLLILIRVGAFNWINKPKKQVLWEAHTHFNKHTKRTYTTQLFEEGARNYQFPDLQSEPLEQAFNELEILGFPLCNPFLLMDSEEKPEIHAHELLQHLSKKVKLIGYMVTTKYTHTKNHELMHFGTFYDEKGQVFDTVHFPNEAKKYPFRGKGFYLIQGKVVQDHGYPMIEVNYMQKQGWKIPEAMKTA